MAFFSTGRAEHSAPTDHHPHLTRRGLMLGVAAFGLAAPALAADQVQGQAQRQGPRLTLETPTVFETGSEHYHTAELTFPHPFGLADHRVRFAWPRGPVPQQGFAAVHMLDGRAVAAQLNEAQLARFAKAGGPAIVAHGHALDGRFAQLERTQDYTPPDAAGALTADPRGRAGGGAARYLALMARDILPAIEAAAPLDPARRTLWGHSYGGLCVLQAALFSHSPFARFVSASPALWWDYGAFWQRAMDQGRAGRPGLHLDLHSGSAERARASRPKSPDAQPMIQMRDALPEDALTQLDSALRAGDIAGRLDLFDGLSHGEAFVRSARQVLAETAGLPVDLG